MSDAYPLPSQLLWLRPVVVALVVAYLIVRAAPAVWEPDPFGVQGMGPTDVGGIRLRDFPSHLRFARAVWSGDWRVPSPPPSSAYSPASHRRMMTDWLGPPQERALPFGYSPTMLWLFAPLAPLSDRAAYLVWTSVGLALVTWMLSCKDVPWLAGALLFLSPVTDWSVLHGQTAICSTAGFLFLYRYSVAPRPGSVVPVVLVLWAMTAKPPVAVTAAAALLAGRLWRPVVGAVALTGLSTVVVSPWLGVGWVGDYLALLGSYNSEQADPTFAWSLEPLYMSSLRAVLYWLGCGDARASQVCTVLWVAAGATLTVAGYFRGLSVSAAWALAILVLLLFSPHANLTEELHLYVGATAALLLVAGSTRTVDRLLPLLFTAVFWLGCLLKANSPWLYPVPAFVGKAALAGTVVWVDRRRPSVSDVRK